ncbi:bacteriocin-like protein [Chryseobacterium lactis]|uniref:bacteriocin-like protein n=1 Tax=Chryseobacterium lactis TaxID=1241981 RepID=UPI000A92D3C6
MKNLKKISRKEMKVVHGGEEDTGCFYNFRHYEEGERVITVETLLECVCHNRMLTCYLIVLPHK